jgi:hypothetical protein
MASSQAKSRRHLQNKRRNPLERNAEGCCKKKDGALSSQERKAEGIRTNEKLNPLERNAEGFAHILTINFRMVKFYV